MFGNDNRLIVTLSCRLKQEKVAASIIDMLYKDCKNVVVNHPFMENDRILPIQEKRKRYIEYIKRSHVLIAISKSDECIEIGKSVSWEVAIAEHFNIPVLYMLNKEV